MLGYISHALCLVVDNDVLACVLAKICKMIYLMLCRNMNAVCNIVNVM